MVHSAKRIHLRITQAEANGLELYKTFVYTIRCISAGATEFLRSSTAGKSQDPGQRTRRPDLTRRPPILVQDVVKGKSNAIMNLLGQLMLKVALKFPDVFFADVDPKEQVINAKYLKERLGPTIYDGVDANPETCLAVLDYLMGGLGCLYLPVNEDGAPGWRWADTLDLIWDQTVRTPNKATWMAMVVSEPLWKWLEMFPDSETLKKHQSAAARARKGDADEGQEMDYPVALCFYYDIELGGHQFVFLKTGENTYEPEPVYEGENPHKRWVRVQADEAAGSNTSHKKKPFLPFACTFYMAWPSVGHPIGVAQKMLPSQCGIWKAIEYIDEVLERGSGFYTADQTKFKDDAAKKEFLKARKAGVVWVEGSPEGVIKQEAPMMIPPSVMEELKRNTSDIREEIGMSYAATGQGTPSPGGGKMTAAEFRSIEGQSQLTATAVSTDVTRMIEHAIPCFLWNAKSYDDRPWSCKVGNVWLYFGPGKADLNTRFLGPVGSYLRPDAWITVSEDSMSHVPRSQKIAEKEHVVDVALKAAPLLQMPAVALAFTEFLNEMGIDNADDYLKPPAQPSGPPTGQMAGQAGTGG